MIIQLKGNIKFQITLDPSTWIFDDRKLKIEELLTNKEDEEQILFNDEAEWNRQIIEGETKPPTLKSEKKYKKRELLDSSFAICLKPFLEYTEPNSVEDAEITFIHNDGETTLPYNEREEMYAHFSNNGKRLYDDGMFDLIVVNNGHESLRLTHVTGIEFK